MSAVTMAIFLHNLRIEAEQKNLLSAIEPHILILIRALPYLEKILNDLRGNGTTTATFQTLIIRVCDDGDYRASTQRELMHAYTRTHNDSATPGRKPVVAIAQQTSNIISDINDILELMRRLDQEKGFLEHELANA